jgi:Transposase DDE domain group 1/Carbon-nitrogen hydrolase
MTDATGEAKQSPLRVAFDRRLKLEFHGTRITSDGGLLVYRWLDDALGLTALAVSGLAEDRRVRNIRHRLLSLLRQMAASQCGERPDGKLTRYGHSLIVSPWGEVVADAGEGPGLALARIDLAQVARARAAIAALRHARAFAGPG